MPLKLSSLQSLEHYVDFDQESGDLLRSLHPVAKPHFEAIIDDFYDAIEAHPEAKEVITGGSAQIARLKSTLVSWLESLLLGPRDEAYLERHARIGRVHVRIDLPQQLMFGAINRIRARLQEVIERELKDPTKQIPYRRAVDQALDLELAIMLATYREDLVERMRTHERLATIGQLTASIGHELRNPLGVVDSSLFLIRQRLQKREIEDPRLSKHIDRIAGQVRIASKTITDLMALAQRREPRKVRFAANSLVDRAREQAGLPATYSVENEVSAHLELFGDPDQIAQVVSNLMGNAAQARADGSMSVAGRVERGGIELHLVDDGPGIPKDIWARVFDALFTTRAKGTGLGLSLARRIVESHGGALELVRGPEEVPGARFRLWLPLDEAGNMGDTSAEE